ncbi:tetratricopeptide repeat protein [Anaeramoeba flamelloides]|uniref:Tetratricopeptide repeat protein n=1 Tax=Anaeramoeba flamelloides TaxID=1746091 RepID=A0ABQ8YG50_9EUKA|nr:tetratricopeptide repeat protein [Anaeramoeba flamelloides]
MDYLSCIDRMIHIIDNQFFEKNYVFLLLRAISYFNEKKYELAIRDCSLIIDKLPNNAESFYQKACLQYILNDTQSSKKSLLQASRKQNFSDPKLSKIFTKDIKELENIVTKSEKKNIKNSEKDQFVEKCKKNYFSINSVPRYQTLLIDKITQEEITQLFQEKNLPSVDILGDIIDETDSGDFSQSFLELLTRKRFAKERTNSKKNQIQPQQNSNNINNINTLEN